LTKNNYTNGIDLSEQELVDCCDQCHAHISDRCGGGYLDFPFKYARYRFISYENFYEYKAEVHYLIKITNFHSFFLQKLTYLSQGGQCQRQLRWNKKIANILMTGFTCALFGEDEMRDTIAGVGTIATAVYINEDFVYYRS